MANLLEALEALVVGRAQVRRDVLHHRAARKSLERRRGVRPSERARVALLDERVDEEPGLIEMADPYQVVGVRDDGVGDIAPARRVGFDAQEIDEQILIEAAQRGVADGREPRRDPFRRVVADAFDVDRQGPRMR